LGNFLVELELGPVNEPAGAATGGEARPEAKSADFD